ncbi:hypothetical protein EDB85DRAFT_1126124 [Lactarius pseudohatsudake]|nr:hypothetical protein EDB85DRAFT_1126124 [Lactarius pseudohatsudake]
MVSCLRRNSIRLANPALPRDSSSQTVSSTSVMGLFYATPSTKPRYPRENHIPASGETIHDVVRILSGVSRHTNPPREPGRLPNVTVFDAGEKKEAAQSPIQGVTTTLPRKPFLLMSSMRTHILALSFPVHLRPFGQKSEVGESCRSRPAAESCGFFAVLD